MVAGKAEARQQARVLPALGGELRAQLVVGCGEREEREGDVVQHVVQQWPYVDAAVALCGCPAA